ncbi:hypothetical protein D9M71_429350 [compost metagenome]
MGHGQHLPTLAEPAQQLADDFCGRAANADVDFVEHQGRYTGGLCGDHLNRQADPRQFAAGCHFRQGLQRLAGVGADQQFYLFEPVWQQFVAAVRAQFNGETAAGHAQSLDFLLHGAGQAVRGLMP